ncbi:myelin protein zero-like protein 1 isoform X3 [Columba livia]|uniref:myelin protein zero-like protein 1 isoform X3 n=1 Tax=Columba livia TaxID=8932 RepID=UPI0031BB2571
MGRATAFPVQIGSLDLTDRSSGQSSGRNGAGPGRERGGRRRCVRVTAVGPYPGEGSGLRGAGGRARGRGRTMGARGGGGRKMAAAGGTAERLAAAAPARLPGSVWLLAAAVAALTAVKVSAVEVNTPEEIFVENGTDAKLPCTFTSVEVISSAASVSWSFQPEGAATRISFFYYFNGKPYPGKDIPFKDRITWAGDLNKKDASISISNMQFRDNGTYICDVKNPPDIVVKPGEIRVRVVEKDSLPAFPIAMVAGIVIGTVTGLSPLISIVVCLVIRKNNSKKRYSGDPDIDARLGM